MSYLIDFGAITLTREIAELYSRLLHRADDDETAEVRKQVGEVLTQARDLLKERWGWSQHNPPAILRDE